MSVETNGRDFFRFWQVRDGVRVAKLVEGEQRTSRHVFDTRTERDVSVTWTGTHFFVVAPSPAGLVGQLLDAGAEPVGATFPLSSPAGRFDRVAIASNGRIVLLLYERSSWDGLHAVALTPAGVPTGISVALGRGNSFALASNGSGFAAVVETLSSTDVITFDGEGRERSRATIDSVHGRYPVIASNGHDYLATWRVRGGGGVRAAFVQADGSPGAPIVVEPALAQGAFTSLDAAWTGTSWAVAYAKDVSTWGGDSEVRVAYVHPTEPRVVRYDDAGPGYSPSVAAADGRTLMAWRPALYEAPLVASFLPLADREWTPLPLAAAEQDLLAVASGNDATLAVWMEEYEIWTGVLSRAGGWTERELDLQQPGGYGQLQTASDGRGFLVVVNAHHEGSANVASAFFLDQSARVTAGPVPLPIYPHSIIWTGSEYLLASTHSIVRLTRNGTVAARVRQVNFTVDGIASNGATTMVVMRAPGLDDGGLRFATLGPGLRPMDEPRPFAGHDDKRAAEVEVVWDGTRFVAAWTTADKVYVAELPPGEREATVVARFQARLPIRPHMIALAEGVALTWRERGSAGRDKSVAGMVRRDGSTATFAFEHGAISYPDSMFLAALPDGRLAHVGSMQHYRAPHYGSTRVLMRIGGSALPLAPEPPRLSGVLLDGRMELSWIAPPQPVAGYRIEYRIDHDVWQELEAAPGAHDISLTLPWPPRQGERYQFRIRAFSDSGTSEYSNVVVMSFSKRRSVR